MLGVPLLYPGKLATGGSDELVDFTWLQFFELLVICYERTVFTRFGKKVAGECGQICEGFEALLGEGEDLPLVLL